MNREDELRSQVSETYARAITESQGCCGGVPGQPDVARLGYKSSETDRVPTEATTTSFGCGNPLAFTHVCPGETVLDLGSGGGLDLLIASQRVGPTGRVIGVDMTDAMIERARANIARAGVTNVEVRRGLIEELPVESASVDWVISNCVLNLSPEKEKVFGEIARVLRPGGRIMISDIVADDLPTWVRDNIGLYCSCVAGTIAESTYVAGLRQAGLTDVEVIGRNVYDESQLRALAQTELAPLLTASSGCCASAAPTPDFIDATVKACAGKVASVTVSARKP